MAVYFFYGEEDYNIEQEINTLKQGLDKNFLDMSYKVYDHPKFVDLISILRSQPLMFGKMVVVIQSVNYFSKTFEDKEIKEITSALENNNENLDVVFVAELPRDGRKKIDSRKKFFKLLSKFNAKNFPLIPSYKTAELEGWIKKQASGKKLKMTQPAITTLLNQVGNNLRQLDRELDKLQLVAYPENIVTPEMVKENCISNEDLFVMTDYLLAGEKDKALQEYRKITQKKHYLELFGALHTIVRRWIIYKAKSSKMSATELSRLTGTHEYVIKLTLQKLKNTSLKDLVKLKNNLTEAEFRIKSGKSLIPEDELERVIFS